ncbi:MAG: pre-peptidase C-terminal domain-containing protein, partial [Rhodoferax sp.]
MPDSTPDKVNGTSITDAGSATTSAYVLSGASGTTSITGSVGGSDTNDYYKFVAPGTGIATFSLTGLSQDIDLILLNSSGTAMRNSTNGGANSENISQGIIAGQTYFVQVDPYNAAVSNYSLSMTLPAASTTTATPD